MNHFDIQTPVTASPGNLEQTSWVAGGDDTRTGRDDPVNLSLEQAPGDRRLEQIVNAGAAAAEVALGKLDEREPGDPPQ